MNARNLILPLISTAAVLALTPSLHAQTTFPATWSNSSVDFELRADGTFIEKGVGTTINLSGTDEGAGTRLLWYPALSAFRCGTVTGTDWDQTNIGQYSFSFGLDNFAGNTGGIAMGENNNAGFDCGKWSVALGSGNSAGGDYSVAIGSSCTANSTYGVAIGSGSVAGYQAAALGSDCNATTNWTLALGFYATASAFGAVALTTSTASGADAFASGDSTLASGQLSATFNYETLASSYCSTAMGMYNVGGGTATSWVATDPLFEVGNGTSSSARSDAFIVQKNGNATFQGTVSSAPGGDIPMFAGY